MGSPRGPLVEEDPSPQSKSSHPSSDSLPDLAAPPINMVSSGESLKGVLDQVSLPLPKRLSAESTMSSADGAGAPFCVMMDRSKRRQAEIVVDATLSSLPVRPDRVSDVKSPFLTVNVVDGNTVDVQVTHHFRAHFDNPGGYKQALKNLTEAQFNGRLALEAGPKNALAAMAAVPHSAPDVPSSSHQPAPQNRALNPPDDLSYFRVEELQDDGRSPRAAAPGFEGGTPLVQMPSTTLHSPPSSRPRAWGPWEVDPGDVLVGERIAMGGFAEVFLGKYQGTLVAVKLLLHVDGGAASRFCREVQLLASLRHPNLILFMGYAMKPYLAILSE
jgi:hypothetical protein